jgi:hypothetical protein
MKRGSNTHRRKDDRIRKAAHNGDSAELCDEKDETRW